MFLETRSLSKNFDGLAAVQDVDFTLQEGEIRALIGPNGAGKSTFVSMLCGRIRASSGQVLLDGQDITSWPVHRRIARGIAYTFQITSVFADLDLRENVALAARRRYPGQAAKVQREVEAALARTGLLERIDQRAGDLSYGHQRLLEIAMGLAQAPRLYILDEPTQGLSGEEITAFLALIRDLAREATILLIEHNMQVVMEAAARITVLDQGRLLAEGSLAEIRANAAVQAAYLGGGDAEG